MCLNDIDSISLNRSCVGDTTGEIEFSLATDSAYSSIRNTGVRPELKKTKTKITTLDNYLQCKSIERIDVIKIDVEGAEKLVLDGAQNLFANPAVKPRLVLMELAEINFKAFNTSIPEVAKIMLDYGYTAFVLEKGQKTEFRPGHWNKIYNVFLN